MFKIGVIGDIFPGNLDYHIGTGIASKFHKHQGEPWLKTIQDLFSPCKYVVGNLEAPLVHDNLNPHKKAFIGSTNFATFLKRAGVNIISVANNHMLDHGSEAFLSTIKALKNAGIHASGYLNEQKQPHLEFIDENNIGFCAFNDIHDNLENIKYLTSLSNNNIQYAIKGFSQSKAKLKIASVHWGNEYINYPSSQQIVTARKMIDLGFDIVIGHHPHVVQPEELYQQGIIYYSMGNFMFDSVYANNVRNSKISYCTISDNYTVTESAFKNIRIQKNYTIVPLINGYCENIQTQYLPLIKNYKADQKDEYDKTYFKQVRNNRYIQRLKMKKDLLKELMRFNPQVIQRLLRIK